MVWQNMNNRTWEVWSFLNMSCLLCLSDIVCIWNDVIQINPRHDWSFKSRIADQVTCFFFKMQIRRACPLSLHHLVYPDRPNEMWSVCFWDLGITSFWNVMIGDFMVSLNVKSSMKAFQGKLVCLWLWQQTSLGCVVGEVLGPLCLPCHVAPVCRSPSFPLQNAGSWIHLWLNSTSIYYCFKFCLGRDSLLNITIYVFKKYAWASMENTNEISYVGQPSRKV